jgi:hypothetical protein
MIEKWSDVARQYDQMAVGALILPIFFIMDIGGIRNDTALWSRLNL